MTIPRILMAAALAVALHARPASAAVADQTFKNAPGTALYFSLLRGAGETVTIFNASTAVNSTVSFSFPATVTVYSIEAEVICDNGTPISATGWLLFSWSSTMTGGMTSAAGANGEYNLLHFTAFGMRTADTDGLRFPMYAEDGILKVGPTVHIGTPSALSRMPADTVKVRIRAITSLSRAITK